MNFELSAGRCGERRMPLQRNWGKKLCFKTVQRALGFNYCTCAYDVYTCVYTYVHVFRELEKFT